MNEAYYPPSNCPICGASLNTDCMCPNSWRSDHNVELDPFPVSQQAPSPQQISAYFSHTPEVVVAIRELVAELQETRHVLCELINKVRP